MLDGKQIRIFPEMQRRRGMIFTEKIISLREILSDSGSAGDFFLSG